MFNRKAILSVLLILLFGRIALMFLFPVSDPSEARYALIIKRMADTNNYLEPQLFHEGQWMNFEGKPPLFFQMGGVCSELFGNGSFPARLPSLLSALGILAIVYFSLRKMRDERTALFAVLFCASSVVFFLFSGLAMTDMTLNLAVTGAVFSYMLFSFEPDRGKKKWYSLGFFAALAVGMLAKGPVALVMAGLPVFVFVLWNNRWKELKDHAWVTGTLLFLLIAAPWFILMARKNPDFLEYFFINENFKRFLFKEYGDRYGAGRETFCGMAVIWFLLSALPAFLLVLPPLFRKTERKALVTCSGFSDPVTGLSLLGVLCITGFWSLTSRVLVTYLLPTVPLFSVWLADRMNVSGAFENRKYMNVLKYGFAGFAFFLLIGFGVAAVVGQNASDKMPQALYRRVAERMETDPQLKGKPLYFARETPYSAVLFFGEKAIRHHEDEKVPTGVRASRNAVLFIREYHVRKLKTPIGRKELFRDCKWVVYAPES